MADRSRTSAERQASSRRISVEQVTSRESMYRIAYEESKRTLDDQQDELNGMRGRCVQFAAFVGSATAFLAGSGLKATTRDVGFYVLAGLATAASAALIGLLISVLRPSYRNSWNYRLSAKDLVTDWIETEVPPPSEAHFLRALAETYDNWRVSNEKLLMALRCRYSYLIVLGSTQVVLWAVLVWAKA